MAQCTPACADQVVRSPCRQAAEVYMSAMQHAKWTCRWVQHTDSAIARRRVVEDSLELFTCKPTAGDSEFPDVPGNSSSQGSYNELATLMTVTGAAYSS